MQNQNDFNSFNNIVNQNYQRNNESKSANKSKYYLLGMATGIVVSMVFTFMTVSIIRFYRSVQLVREAQNVVVSDSVTDDAVVEKLGVLEETVEKYFWKDVEDQTLQDGIYKGMLAALDDPYSVYYTNDELIELQQQTEGIYYGIGAYISKDLESGYVQISKIIKGTPAEESNLMQGDYIYAINGENMQGRESEYVVSKIKGEEGTFVTITVLREGAASALDIDVERRKIESPTVEYVMYDDGMAYIQITEFDLVTTGQFESAYNQARVDGMKGLIIDLRSNPGGNLSTVCDIARMLLPEGLIVYTEDKYGNREEYKCKGENKIDVPLVVLADGYSASASEILTGAVKDYGIGTIVGTTTFGKGIVQKVINLSDGSALKLTVSTYYTPNGNNIHGIGIEPDVEVPFDAEQYQNGVDNQLEKAKEVLAGMMN